MDIYLLRHAEADPLGESNHYRDEERALTEGGQRQMLAVAKGLKPLGIQFNLIAASPLVRARETAEIIAKVFKYDHPVSLWEELCPGARPSSVFERFNSLKATDSILLAGHEPDMGLLASHLLVGSGKVHMPFKKAGLCLIQVDQIPPLLPGELKWMIPPKILARPHTGK
jgi:phosphohistidine phosphatase